MRRGGFRWCWVSALALVALPAAAPAGAKLKVGEDFVLDVGARVQAYFLTTQANTDDSDPDFEREHQFLVRRARLRVRADIGPYVGAFVQTDFSDDTATSGADMRVIDAYVLLKPLPALQLYLGEQQAPGTRQNLSSSSALLAMDRPSIAYKNLSWGVRARPTFNGDTLYGAGLTTTVAVRDLGATLFGEISPAPTVHVKYYGGVYQGATTAEPNVLRYAARAQVNLFDQEDGYYNSATYLGEKRTVGIGATVDFQPDVEEAANATGALTGDRSDYLLLSADVFAEYPVGIGAVTAEAGWQRLALGDVFYRRGTPLAPVAFDTRIAAGNGYFVQAGFYFARWQPWAEWEQWFSDDAADVGDFRAVRFGISYYLRGFNANAKVGYEIWMPSIDFPGTNARGKGTLVVGLFTNL